MLYILYQDYILFIVWYFFICSCLTVRGKSSHTRILWCPVFFQMTNEVTAFEVNVSVGGTGCTTVMKLRSLSENKHFTLKARRLRKIVTFVSFIPAGFVFILFFSGFSWTPGLEWYFFGSDEFAIFSLIFCIEGSDDTGYFWLELVFLECHWPNFVVT